jgi:hypothetical protein
MDKFNDCPSPWALGRTFNASNGHGFSPPTKTVYTSADPLPGMCIQWKVDDNNAPTNASGFVALPKRRHPFFAAPRFFHWTQDATCFRISDWMLHPLQHTRPKRSRTSLSNFHQDPDGQCNSSILRIMVKEWLKPYVWALLAL